MVRFEGQTVWITGASSGIGEALARVFSAEGASVILSGRRVDALEAVAKTMDTDTLILPFEATDYPALAPAVDAAWAWKGRVDVLVNNAGVSQRSLAVDTAPDVYRDLIDIDLIAPIWLTQLQLPRMVDAGGAHIVAISSVAGRIGAPLRTAYCAAKHGLIGYMDALRAEVEKLHKIKVTNVLPGSVATNVSRNAMTADGSSRGRSDAAIDGGDDPMDCARAIVDAVVNGVPELLFAQGQEREAAMLRHADPDAFFDLIRDIGAVVAEHHVAERNAQETDG
ncbi:MAG: SDR family NAD(P)-dependent oxidoreductase [Alphaproteobacteria bacterium]